MTELDKLADALCARLAARDAQTRPRPDLHAEHDRRISALESRIERIVDAVEKLVTVETQRSAVIGHWKWITSNWPQLSAFGVVLYMLLQDGGVSLG